MTEEHRLSVLRTARFSTLGPTSGAVRELWFVLHGYGQLARYFLQSFTPLDDGTRLIVAPEALSRFYLDAGVAGRHAEKVGASWMTKEDRETEIADYIGYLDALHDQVRHHLGSAPRSVWILGFSQGAATATRWVVRGKVRDDELILWGGALPNEVDPAAPPPTLRTTPVSLVVGEADRMVDRSLLDTQMAGLRSLNPSHRLVAHPGGHRIDPEVLLQVVSH